MNIFQKEPVLSLCPPACLPEGICQTRAFLIEFHTLMIPLVPVFHSVCEGSGGRGSRDLVGHDTRCSIQRKCLDCLWFLRNTVPPSGARWSLSGVCLPVPAFLQHRSLYTSEFGAGGTVRYLPTSSLVPADEGLCVPLRDEISLINYSKRDIIGSGLESDGGGCTSRSLLGLVVEGCLPQNHSVSVEETGRTQRPGSQSGCLREDCEQISLSSGLASPCSHPIILCEAGRVTAAVPPLGLAPHRGSCIESPTDACPGGAGEGYPASSPEFEQVESRQQVGRPRRTTEAPETWVGPRRMMTMPAMQKEAARLQEASLQGQRV